MKAFPANYCGYEAYLEGESPSANPHEPGTTESEDWLAGWRRAKGEEEDEVDPAH